MNRRKQYFILIIISTSLILLYCLFELFRFTQGVNDDTKRALFVKKEYLIHTYFKGKVVNKEICEKCPELKWGIVLKIDTIKEPSSSNILDRAYQPYYEFDGDSLLYIKVPLSIYNKIELENILVKNSGSTYIDINNIETLQLLSEDREKWLYDE